MAGVATAEIPETGGGPKRGGVMIGSQHVRREQTFAYIEMLWGWSEEPTRREKQ